LFQFLLERKKEKEERVMGVTIIIVVFAVNIHLIAGDFPVSINLDNTTFTKTEGKTSFEIL